MSRGLIENPVLRELSVKAHGNSVMIKLNAEGQYVKALEGF